MGTIAAFDLDGTLSRRDTVLPFLARVAGRGAVAAALARESRALWRMRAGGDHRDVAKAALLARVLDGRVHDELRIAGERFAAELAGSGLRNDVLARLRWHQSAGHAVVIVTAALDVYAAPLAARLGAVALATRLAVDEHGRCTGEIDGANCRGEEKVRRIRAHFDGAAVMTLWAYGDSADDEALLASADVAVRVGRAPIAVAG